MNATIEYKITYAYEPSEGKAWNALNAFVMAYMDAHPNIIIDRKLDNGSLELKFDDFHAMSAFDDLICRILSYIRKYPIA